MATIANKPVGPTGYGMMNLTWRTTPIPDAQAFATLKAALASGANLWNGGEFYGTPDTNSLLLLKRYFTRYPEDADKVILSIKGCTAPGTLEPDGSAKNVRRSVEDCLKMLDGTKSIDIFEAARVDPKVGIEATTTALAELVKEGKIGSIGLSEATADQIRAAAAVHPIAAVEVEMSIQTPDILHNGVAAACGDLGIPIVAYSPLGRGLLTATITKPEHLDKDDIRFYLARFQGDALEKNAALGLAIQKLADAKRATAAQVAIAWVRSFSQKEGYGVIVPIPGSTTAERAVENSQEVELTEADLREIEDLMKGIHVVGARGASEYDVPDYRGAA